MVRALRSDGMERIVLVSGDRADLLDWNYHDIERLVEADIRERFGYAVK